MVAPLGRYPAVPKPLDGRGLIVGRFPVVVAFENPVGLEITEPESF